MPKKKEWFGEWFNSPYYHILYKNRDTQEAEDFLDRLIEYLAIGEKNKIIDVACGKGRHSIYLNKKGFDVVGIDLSEENIKRAKKHENNRLKFYVHDMRQPFQNGAFCYVFNFFTSFGYFDTEKENQDAIQSMADNLKPGGVLILDFLNPYRVIHHLIQEEVKHIDGIDFHLTREFEDGFIVKNIRFQHRSEEYFFQEKVKSIRRAMFENYFRLAGLEVKQIFGDYYLNEYHNETSERMIFECLKP
jgi:SAM-dependent methyltransferase